MSLHNFNVAPHPNMERHICYHSIGRLTPKTCCYACNVMGKVMSPYSSTKYVSKITYFIEGGIFHMGGGEYDSSKVLNWQRVLSWESNPVPITDLSRVCRMSACWQKVPSRQDIRHVADMSPTCRRRVGYVMLLVKTIIIDWSSIAAWAWARVLS